MNLNDDVTSKALDDLIDALYSSELGIDQRSHEAVCTLLFLGSVSKEEGERRVKDLNARVDATDGIFYFS